MPAEVKKSVSLAAVRGADLVWRRICTEADAAMTREPALAGFMLSAIFRHDRFEAAVISRVASRLDHRGLDGDLIAQAFTDALESDPSIGDAFRADLAAVVDRDPACTRLIEPLLYFKGFHALQTHRLAHHLWTHGRKDFALYLQSRSSEVFQTDINPAARIGKGIFLDHATGLVVGETATIGDNVSMLQDVTLGGTGKAGGDRHPKVRDCVLIGAGAKVLGNIEIGSCARIAAGSVVLHEVPPRTTVAGVPAKIVGEAGCPEPGLTMDQLLQKIEGLDA
ncbi:serine O-acetyltransferase [Rhizobiales bacterium GAS191]|nr:serine O-acetyltransferase [Rhizobiales bacterium GAS113]SEE08459.1 serine O-acetyltransferase [Rhizobiales bacterium GAS191]SEE45584.1 serine O-acetyltransferase [Rhizobiales bacterium GAS188]